VLSPARRERVRRRNRPSVRGLSAPWGELAPDVLSAPARWSSAVFPGEPRHRCWAGYLRGERRLPPDVDAAAATSRRPVTLLALARAGSGEPLVQQSAALDELPVAALAQGRSPASERDLGGTGPGLPIARRIATQRGGAITLNRLPGRGTTVTGQLPLAKPAARIPGFDSAPARPGTATTLRARRFTESSGCPHLRLIGDR
jgi:hypothetical protein